MSAKRERLRQMMADCPACVAEDANHIPEADLDRWISSHEKAHAVASVSVELTDEDKRILRQAGVEVP
jgi:hypothetical protein